LSSLTVALTFVTSRSLHHFFYISIPSTFLFFFFNHTSPTEIYTLSLHDALPIFLSVPDQPSFVGNDAAGRPRHPASPIVAGSTRSEEHTSELQSLAYLVCRLLLEKKKKKKRMTVQQKSRNEEKSCEVYHIYEGRC